MEALPLVLPLSAAETVARVVARAPLVLGHLHHLLLDPRLLVLLHSPLHQASPVP